MRNKRRKITVIFFLLLVIAAAGIYSDNNCIEVTHYTVKSDKIPASFNGFKILQISDLHSKSFGKDNARLVKKINSENPDIVVMTGDMVNSEDTGFEVFTGLVEKIGKNCQVFYIVGNHEQNLSTDRQEALTEKLDELGVDILDNEKVTIVKGPDSINLYGLWFNLRYYKDMNNEYTKDVFFGEEQINTVLGMADDDSFNILLTHNPLYADTYAEWGADLTLSGHVHGGMIRIPFIGGLLSPERVFFPEYDSGEYTVDGKTLIVNRGLGNGYFGVRIFNMPEISVITLSN